jgi:hypothetical protein
MSCVFGGRKMEKWLCVSQMRTYVLLRRRKSVFPPVHALQTRRFACGSTLFHKVKFPPVKAFYTVYFVATGKKDIALTELSRKLGLGQKTCPGTSNAK